MERQKRKKTRKKITAKISLNSSVEKKYHILILLLEEGLLLFSLFFLFSPPSNDLNASMNMLDVLYCFVCSQD